LLRSLRSPPQARDLVAIATGHAPKFASGKSWAYSNTNYVLLGLIVETATGNPVGHELEQRIFWPLHLWATSFDTDDRFSDRRADGAAPASDTATPRSQAAHSMPKT
jgi:CubicO group peptidase (beta-lactamase class C family)